MKSKLLGENGGLKTFALILQTDDEVMSSLEAFARENKLSGSRFTAIGAFREATLGYFDWSKKDYKKIAVQEQVEVVSLIGDIALDKSGKPKLHVHVVLGRSDGTALGGHLLRGHVRPTLEVMLDELPIHLRREHDEESGLALIRL